MQTLIESKRVGIEAAIARLGERQTEDLKVPGSIQGLGMRACSCLRVRRRFAYLLAKIHGTRAEADGIAPRSRRSMFCSVASGVSSYGARR